MKKVTLVCDGSSLGNGRDSARAGAFAVLIYVDKEGKSRHRVVGEYLGFATNNQAEIVAAAIGLEALKVPCDVEVITDSQYVVETQKGNYRQKANHDYWRRLNAAARPHRVKWTWTRGHNNHPIQEECDRGAKMIAASGSPDHGMLDEMLKRIKHTNWPSANV